MTRVYKITFNEYTNTFHDTVSDNKEIGKTTYIHVGEEPFLIFEDDINYYRKFGCGIKTLEFVGNINKHTEKARIRNADSN